MLKIDYKGGKHFIFQDRAYEFDYVVGEVDETELTDDYLKDYLSACQYYDVPYYIGDNKKFKKRLKKLVKEI